jgi:EmrB/QacA subfamily drug resistance transporter
LKYKWTVLTVTTVGVLMSGLDTRIVIIGLPQVAAALGADAEQAIWFTQAYVLASTISLLLIGRATDIIGRVKIYTAGFAVFSVGSLLVSFAQDPWQVIIFRGVQGIGSAMLMTNSAALIADATPKNELGLSLGINQIALRFGMMGGLTLSGIILAYADWRALFYINIPIGIFGTIWAQRRLKEVAKTDKGEPMDWAGFVCFTIAIVSLLLALTFDAYGMADRSLVLGLEVVTVAAFAVFIIHERRTSIPLLDLRILAIKEFTGGVVAQFLNSIAWGAVALLLSLYFQLVLGLSPFEAGIRILPIDIAFLLFGPLSGKLSDKYGHMPFTTSGLALSSIALYLFSTADAATPYSMMILYLAIFGAGVGLFSSPNMSSLMGSVPSDRRGIASAVRAVFFQTGNVISLNLAILIMTMMVPYRIVSAVICKDATITASEATLFASGLSHAFIWMAAINACAIVPSLLRGKRVEETQALTIEEKGDDVI